MSETNTSPQQSSLTERAWLTCRKRPYLQGPRRAGFRTHRLVSGPCQTYQHKTRQEQAAGTFPSVSPQDLRCCQGRAKGCHASLLFPKSSHLRGMETPPSPSEQATGVCCCLPFLRKEITSCRLPSQTPPLPDSPVRFTKCP